MSYLRGILVSDRLYSDIVNAAGNTEKTLYAVLSYLFTGDDSGISALSDQTRQDLAETMPRLRAMRKRYALASGGIE